MSEEKTMPPSNDWCRFISSSSSSSPSLVPFPFPHVVETGDVLVLGEELGGRLLLQVVRLARLGRHCVPIRWSPKFSLPSGLSLSLPLSLWLSACSRRAPYLEQEVWRARACSKKRGSIKQNADEEARELLRSHARPSSGFLSASVVVRLSSTLVLFLFIFLLAFFALSSLGKS
jgi:hypothetical protein